MVQAKGIREVGYLDCPGGGQIVVDRNIAYIGHITSPHGTSTVDVTDPRHPRLLETIDMPMGTHSHKVRVENNLMIINREVIPHGVGAPPGFLGGLGIYDVAKPGRPKFIANWEAGGTGVTGVHRFDFDGRYAYISPTVDGYLGNIVMILDLVDPAHPVEVARWWLPGQWTAGGEMPTWKGTAHRCHHPLRRGNRLYTSYWHGGFVILDIDEMRKPKLVSHADWSPPFTCPTHTVLPVPFPVAGHTIMLIADEDTVKLHLSPPAFMWIVEISDETRPVPFASFQLEHLVGVNEPQAHSGCHQFCEKITGTEIPVAWFAQGLRIVDIANPHAPREVAFFMPAVPEGSDRVQSNDVTVDERGLIFLIDRIRGMHILERC